MNKPTLLENPRPGRRKEPDFARTVVLMLVFILVLGVAAVWAVNGKLKGDNHNVHTTGR